MNAMIKSDSISVSIRFSGSQMDVETLSNLLGCFPTRLRNRTKNVFLNGEKSFIEEQVWQLDFREGNGENLEQKINGLLEKMTSNPQKWREATRKYRGDIFFGPDPDDWSKGYTLSPEMLKRLEERNLWISFSVN